jgi:hypothetical protein
MGRGSSIVIFEPDLLFSSKIESAARKLELEVMIETRLEDAVSKMGSVDPLAIIVNLDAVPGNGLQEFTRNKGRIVLGYYSHVNTRVCEEARNLGVNMVFSRGAFLARIDGILRKIAEQEAAG